MQSPPHRGANLSPEGLRKSQEDVPDRFTNSNMVLIPPSATGEQSSASKRPSRTGIVVSREASRASRASRPSTGAKGHLQVNKSSEKIAQHLKSPSHQGL